VKQQQIKSKKILDRIGGVSKLSALVSLENKRPEKEGIEN